MLTLWFSYLVSVAGMREKTYSVTEFGVVPGPGLWYNLCLSASDGDSYISMGQATHSTDTLPRLAY